MEELFLPSNDGELSYVEANGKIVIEQGTQGFVPAVQSHSMIYAAPSSSFYVVPQSAQQQTSQCIVQSRQGQVYTSSTQDQGSILILQQAHQQGTTNYILQPQQAHLIRDVATGQQIYANESGVIQVPHNIAITGKVATTTNQQAVALGISSPQQNVVQIPQLDSVTQSVNLHYRGSGSPRAKKPAQPRGSILRLPNSIPQQRQAAPNLNQESYLKQLEQKMTVASTAVRKGRGGKAANVAQQRRMVSQQLNKTPDKAVQSESSQMTLPIMFNGADVAATVNPDETVTISINDSFDDQNQNITINPPIEQNFTRQVRGRGRKSIVQQERSRLSKKTKLTQIQHQNQAQQSESQCLDIIAEIPDIKSTSSNAAVQTQNTILLQQPQIVKQGLKGDQLVMTSPQKIPQQLPQQMLVQNVPRQSSPLGQQQLQQVVNSLDRPGRSISLNQTPPQQSTAQQIPRQMQQLVQRRVQQPNQNSPGTVSVLGQRGRTQHQAIHVSQLNQLPPEQRAMVIKKIKEQQQQQQQVNSSDSGAYYVMRESTDSKTYVIMQHNVTEAQTPTVTTANRVTGKTKENCQVVSVNDAVISSRPGESKAQVTSVPPGKKVVNLPQRNFPPGSIRVITDSRKEQIKSIGEGSPSISLQGKEQLLLCGHCGIMCDSKVESCLRCKHTLRKNVSATVASSTHEEKTQNSIVFAARPVSPHSALPSIDKQDFYSKVTAANKRIQPEKKPPGSSARGKGRGRGKSKPVDEPVILTLSSDEEDSNDTGEPPNHLPGPDTQTKTDDPNSPNQVELINRKEPIITEVMDDEPTNIYGGGSKLKEIEANLREMESLSVDKIIGEYSLVECRSVRIGSYKCSPCNRVLFFGQGIRMTVPAINSPELTVVLNIPITSIVKMLCHFGPTVPVFFLYLRPIMATYVRKILKMADQSTFYYDPCSKKESQRRITILPDKAYEEMKSVMKNLYIIPFGDSESACLMDELDQKESNEILVLSCPNDDDSATIKEKVISYEIKTLIIYPTPPIKGAIAITTDDYICLEEEQFLNDVIIDFYLKWLHLTKLSHEDQKRTHMFSTYFYKRLTSKPKKGRRIGSAEDDPSLTAAEKRHSRVKSWTKAVDIFEKDFIVIPINEHSHWFLAIICFPGLEGPVRMSDSLPVPKVTSKKKKTKPKITAKIEIPLINDIEWSDRDEAEGEEDELYDDEEEEDENGAATETSAEEPPLKKIKPEEAAPTPPEVPPPKLTVSKKDAKGIKQSCILIFDSLAGTSRTRIVATLREYLVVEHRAKRGFKKTFDRDTMKGASPKVPQQMNFSDCGIFTLQYAETFFEQPLTDYSLPMKKPQLLDWFPQEVVRSKRESIAKLIQDLMDKYKPNHGLNLPEIIFNSKELTDTYDRKDEPNSEATTESKEMRPSPQEKSDEKQENERAMKMSSNSFSQEKLATAMSKSMKKCFQQSSEVLNKRNFISISVSDSSFVEATERQNQSSSSYFPQETQQLSQPIVTLPPPSKSKDKTVILDSETSEVLLILNPDQETSPEPDKPVEETRVPQLLAEPTTKPTTTFPSLETPKCAVSREYFISHALSNKAVCITTPSRQRKIPPQNTVMTSIGHNLKYTPSAISHATRVPLPPCQSIRNTNLSSGGFSPSTPIRGSVNSILASQTSISSSTTTIERPQITKFNANSKRAMTHQLPQRTRLPSPNISASLISRTATSCISNTTSSLTNSIRLISPATETASDISKDYSILTPLQNAVTFPIKNNMTPSSFIPVGGTTSNLSKDDSNLTPLQTATTFSMKDNNLLPSSITSINSLQSSSLSEVTFMTTPFKPSTISPVQSVPPSSTLKELLRTPSTFTTLNVPNSSVARTPTAASSLDTISRFRNIPCELPASSRTAAAIQASLPSSLAKSTECQISSTSAPNMPIMQSNMLSSKATGQPINILKGELEAVITAKGASLRKEDQSRYSKSSTVHHLPNVSAPTPLPINDITLTSLSHIPSGTASFSNSSSTFSNVVSSSHYVMKKHPQTCESIFSKQTPTNIMNEVRDLRASANTSRDQILSSSTPLLSSSAPQKRGSSRLSSSELFDRLTGQKSAPMSLGDRVSTPLTSNVQSQAKAIPNPPHTSLVYTQANVGRVESTSICNNSRQIAMNVTTAPQSGPTEIIYTKNTESTSNSVTASQRIAGVGSNVTASLLPNSTLTTSLLTGSVIKDKSIIAHDAPTDIPNLTPFNFQTGIPSLDCSTKMTKCLPDKQTYPSSTERSLNFDLETASNLFEGQTSSNAPLVPQSASDLCSSESSKTSRDQDTPAPSSINTPLPKVSIPTSSTLPSRSSSSMPSQPLHPHSNSESEGASPIKSSLSLSSSPLSTKDEVVELGSTTSSSQGSIVEIPPRGTKPTGSRYSTEHHLKKSAHESTPSNEQGIPSVFRFSERGTSSGRTIAPPKRYLDSIEDDVVRKKRTGGRGRIQR